VTALNTLTTVSTWKQNINSKMLSHTDNILQPTVMHDIVVYMNKVSVLL
jgi:hypothetical protein